jgi:hypothetical protein
MTEKEVAITILKRVLAMRDARLAMDEATLAEYVVGYAVALQEVIDWLVEAYAIIQAEVHAWDSP